MEQLPSPALLLLCMVGAYLVGSLPTAVIVAKRVAGVNIKEFGSGNPGASNIYRLLGPRWASVTLGVDVFKGYLPVWIVGRFAEHLTHPVIAQRPIAVMGWIAFAAFVGHVFSVFLRFRGGKGAATGLGAIFAMAPQATTLVILVYAGVLFLTKTFSLATLGAGAAFPVLLYLREGRFDPESLLWGLLVPLLLLLTHRQNVLRILRGGELGMGSKDDPNEEE